MPNLFQNYSELIPHGQKQVRQDVLKCLEVGILASDPGHGTRRLVRLWLEEEYHVIRKETKKEWLRFMFDPKINHCHCNVEINFDPWILKMYAVEAFENVGLKIDWVVPSVYRVPAGFRAKLIFNGAHPEWQHDIAWDFNPDVIIRPATKPFIGVPSRMPDDGDPCFDFNLQSDFEAVVAQGKHVKLTTEEIQEILAQI